MQTPNTIVQAIVIYIILNNQKHCPTCIIPSIRSSIDRGGLFFGAIIYFKARRKSSFASWV
jgi:hypothetical protein